MRTAASRFILSFWTFLFFACAVAHAQEQSTVSLQIPPDLFQRACPAPIWNGLAIQWLGTTDRRPSPEVGLETKKEGRDPIAVLTNPPLTETFDGALRSLFTHCGMKIDPSGAWRVSAVIEEFHAGVEKGLIFGKGKAKSRVTILAESPNRKLSASGGYELEFKKTRKKSLERLTETLNELFAKTLEQLPKSPQLRSMQP
jgi:uncharacterized lipoprotein YajG